MQGLVRLAILVLSVICQDEHPIMGLNHIDNNFIVLGQQYLSQIDIDQQKVVQVNKISRIESAIFQFRYRDYQFIVTSDAQLIQLNIIESVTSYKVIDRNTLDDTINHKIIFATFDSENQKLVVSTDTNDLIIYDLVQLYNDEEDIIIGSRLVQRLGIKGSPINSLAKFSQYLVIGQQDTIRVIDLNSESVIHEWNYLKLNDKDYEYSDIQQIKHLGLSYLVIGYTNGKIIIVDVLSQSIMFYIVNDSPFDIFQVLMTDTEEFYLVVATRNEYITIYGVQYSWFTEEACRKEIKHSVKQQTKSGIKMIEAISDQLGTTLILGYMNSQYKTALIQGIYIQQIDHQANYDQQTIKSDL